MLSLYLWAIDHRWEEIAERSDQEKRDLTESLLDEIAECSEEDFLNIYVRCVEDLSFNDLRWIDREPNWSEIPELDHL
jgi:hypothetical protein